MQLQEVCMTTFAVSQYPGHGNDLQLGATSLNQKRLRRLTGRAAKSTTLAMSC